MPTILQGGKIITETEVLDGFELVVENGKILALRKTDSLKSGSRRTAQDTSSVYIDCSGAWIAPGMVDIHADYIEHMAAPRPTSLLDFGLSLREYERELLTHGITTMFHSLSFYGNADFGVNPIRNAENSRKLIELIHKSHQSQHLIRHRFHARWEIDSVDRVEELKTLIREGKVHLVSFMDHTPGQGQYRNLEIYKLILKGYRKLSDLEADTMIAEGQQRKKLTMEALSEIAQLARDNGIAVASHDDDTVEKLDFVGGFGATISEFPITLEVAREAHNRGLETVAGAPNVLLGGSHSGNLSAAEAVLEGSVDVLCSDYYPAALLHSVFQLHREKGLDLASAFRLVSINPARAVKMHNVIGSIEKGKRADLLVIRQLDDGFPVVSQALVDGHLLFSMNYRR